MEKSVSEQLIVALDVENALAGEHIAARIGDLVSFYKIGLGMLTSGGLALAQTLKDTYGKRVFLDMKLFDIGATIERAVRGFSQFDIDFLTIHGDPQVVEAACMGRKNSTMKLLAVSVLTSLNRADLDAACMKAGTVSEIVIERAQRAIEAGADGVICSVKEAALLRKDLALKDKIIVCPGIRPHGAEHGDQKRAATPADGIRSGASHIVVGRPICLAPDPKAAAMHMQAEIRAAGK